MLIVLSGPSGSGKNTIIKEVMKSQPSLKIMKTCTTRKRRGEGDDAYYFLTEQEFKDKLKNNEFFEYEQVHKGLYYGVLKSSINKVLGKDIYLKDIDVNGYMKLKKEFGENVCGIYLDVPKKVLIDRLLKRGESEESAKKRLSRFEYEKSFSSKYDLVIKNDDLKTTANEIIKFIKNL